MPSSLLQAVNNLFQTCHNNLGTSSANTTCEQTCNNLCVFMRVHLSDLLQGCSNKSDTVVIQQEC